MKCIRSLTDCDGGGRLDDVKAALMLNSQQFRRAGRGAESSHIKPLLRGSVRHSHPLGPFDGSSITMHCMELHHTPALDPRKSDHFSTRFLCGAAALRKTPNNISDNKRVNSTQHDHLCLFPSLLFGLCCTIVALECKLSCLT